jgi:NAD(P)H-hydrate epimerase
MKTVTTRQMKNIDRRTIEQAQVPGLQLMERAGRGAAQVALDLLGDPDGKMVVHFCGRGNNGGDGFVVARLLAEAGARPVVYLVGRIDEVKGEARENLERLQKMDIEIAEVKALEDVADPEKADLVVDALLGTGLSGPVRGLMADLIGLINRAGPAVLSVDIPSGLEADSGRILGCAVRADHTVTMAFPKQGFYFSPGRELVGALSTVDIGIPDWAAEREKLQVETLDKSEMARLIPSRAADAYKGSFGRVLVVAGSVGMTGAAALTSMAALRSGAGMVMLGLPESLNDIAEIKLTEVMTAPLPETENRSLSTAALNRIEELLSWADVVALGPGLSMHSETIALVRQLLPRMKHPTVVDADGLNAIAEDSSLLSTVQAPLVITPHAGELARLSGIDIPGEAPDRIQAVRSLAERYGLICVFKGAPTLIAEPQGALYINTTGNPGMATAGVGDVLTGMIAGFLAQGCSPLDAARLGVFLHGLAGDVAVEERGEWSLVAGDLLDAIDEAMYRTTGQRARRKESGPTEPEEGTER